jgi:hypothetical protein
MVKRVVFVAAVLLSSGAAAESDHAIVPETESAREVTQELCTTVGVGPDGLRTDCRIAVRPAALDNPSLKGICTTYYGRRTCY